VTNCLEMHGTQCDNSATTFQNFFLLASLQIICTPTFKFVPPPLFACIIKIACAKFRQLILRKK